MKLFLGKILLETHYLVSSDLQNHSLASTAREDMNLKVAFYFILPELVLLFGLGFLDGPLDVEAAPVAAAASLKPASILGRSKLFDRLEDSSTGTDNFRFGGDEISNFFGLPESNSAPDFSNKFLWWKTRRRNLSDPTTNGEVSSSVNGFPLKRRSVVFLRTDRSGLWFSTDPSSGEAVGGLKSSDERRASSTI